MVGRRTINHVMALAFGLLSISAGVVLALQGLTASEPWLGPLLGIAGGTADTAAGGLLLVGGAAFAWRFRSVTEDSVEEEIDVEAVMRRVQELD